jgi:hypothetical protein
MTRNCTKILSTIALVFATVATGRSSAQQSPQSTQAIHIVGLTGIKNNSTGTLKVEDGQLRFVHAKDTSSVSATSIEDVVTGSDTQAAVGKTISTLSIAAPYESGRFLALFRSKIDTLTLRYRDGDGGLHGAIFTMPTGAAETIKKQLVAQGVHTAAAEEHDATPFSAVEKSLTKIKAAAIQVEMIQSDETKLPAEFQIALYENLIRQLEKQGGFEHVYRDGDRRAAGASDLVVLHGTVRGFKAGSEKARKVTTVSGATSVTIHCQFTSPDGKSLFERDVSGKVRFFGGNLRATYDFAKKAAHVAHENFTSPDHRP